MDKAVTILLVDDSPVNLAVIVESLEREGAEILVAQDGEEALQRAEMTRPDIILLDVMMPGIDGFEVCRRLKAQAATRDIPVIFMTSLSAVKDKVAGFEAGGVDYLTKPLQLDEVKARVNAHLKLRVLQRQLEEKNASLEREIAERRRMEALIERERATLRAYFDALPDLAWMKDAGGRYLACNPVFESFFGAPEAEIVGRTDYDYVDAKLADFFRRKDREAVIAGRPCVNEEWVTFAGDGRRALLETVKAPVYGADGKVIGVIGVAHDITERSLATEKLNRAHAFTERLIEAMTDPVFVKDRQHRWIRFNDAFCAMLGKSREQLLGKSDYDFLPAEQADVFWEKDELVFTTRRENINEEYITDGAGNLRYIQTKKIMVEGEEGGVLVGVIRDITERRRMEEELHRREEEFRALVENAPDPVFRYDRECRRIYVNRAVLEQTRLPAVELLGRNAAEGRPVVVERDREKAVDAVRAVVETGRPTECEFEFVSPVTGRVHIYQNRYVPELDPDGHVASVLAVCRDVTAFKQALEALGQKERALAEAQRIARLGSWELDHVSGELRWSDEVYRIFEIDPARFGASYQAFIDTVHPDDREAVSRAFVDALQNRTSYDIDHRLLLPDGRIKHVRERCETLYAEDGRPLQSRGTVQDITEIKETQRQLERSQAELRKLAARRDAALENERRLVSYEMHEQLGQVLAALRMKLSSLRRSVPEAGPVAERLTSDMLAMTEDAIRKIRELVTSIRPTTLEMGIVPALEWLAMDFAKGMAITCRLRLEGDPPALDDGQTTAVFRLVQEALANVALHAEAANVEIRLWSEAEAYRLSVRDDGKGIRAEDLDTPGLGIVSMREQAAALGGSCRVGSADGGGTLVEIVFPVIRQATIPFV